MAVKLLQVLVLGVIAAAADEDVPVTWMPSPRASLPCQVPAVERIPARRPPPPLEGEERPKPKPYLWRRGGEDFKRYSNATLEVSKRKDPEGLYQCAVRHQGGLVLGYPVHLMYAYIDKQFAVHPADGSAWRGQPHVLTCNITSGPPATIYWYRDEEPLPKDIRYQMVNNQLIITSVSDEDAGLYKCRGTNSLANKSKTSHGGRLQVESPPADLASAFLPTHHETSIEVPRGSRVVLACPVLGEPKPVLIWEMTPPGQRTGELESTDELLVMPTIELDQEGVYVCRMEGNRHLNKTFNVTISTPVNITHPPESKQAARAGTVRFNCTATGTPPPEVTWYKDGKRLKLAGRIDVVPSVENKRLLQLLIRSVISEDAGVYQCFARNSQSVESAWATLNVTGVEAAAPSDVRCWPAGASDVALRWAKLSDYVMAYTVQTTGPDGASLPWQPVTSAETMINVKSPLTPYSFQVRAYISSSLATAKKNTASVVSDMSESVTCQGQGVPIKLVQVGNGSILVSWRSFFDANPGVVQWILQHKAENSSDEHNVTLAGHVYNHTLHVSPQEPYQIRVLGTRSLPWLQQNLTLVPWTSSSSAGLNIGPGEVRAIPEDVEVTEVNARNFTVRWRFETEPLKTYSFVVCTRRVGGIEQCLESYENSARVSNLEPNSEYEVRVQARPDQTTRRLGGDFSAPIQVNTPPEGHQNFRNLTYKYINMTTVRVSWNSKPKEFTVRHTYEYNLPVVQWTAVDANGNTVLLTGLDPTKKLYVIVEGHDPVGHGSPLLTVPAQIPEAKDLQYTYSKDGVTVTWKGHGPRVVRYSQNLTQPLDLWPTIDVTDTSVQISGLDPGLHTYVMVTPPGPSSGSPVLNILPRPKSIIYNSNVYLGIGIGCGVLVLLVVAAAAICIWQKRKRARSSLRSRRRHSSHHEGHQEESSEMKNVGGRLANGGGSKDAGEPLLNGHVRITENPTQSKTPNGKVRKGQRYEAAFDVTRLDDADITLETVLDPDSSAATTYNLLDTSRRPEFDMSRRDVAIDDLAVDDITINDITAFDAYNKLPDDNMNSEITRSEFNLDGSKVLPTLQPNG